MRDQGKGMQVLAGVSFLLVITASLGVGAKMLLLARKTKALPELALGLSLVLVCAVGYPLAVFNAIFRESLDPRVVYGIAALSQITVNASFALVFVFTWKVFRPGRTWARNLALLGVSLQLVDTVGVLWVVEGRMTAAEVIAAVNWWGVFGLAVVSVAYLWTAFESFHYRGLMLRRLALGLSDPVVCNRFLLWACFGAFSAVGTITIASMLAMGVDVTLAAMGTVAIAITGTGQATCLYLAFLPPKSYLARIRSTAAEV
jgi:hypothetical protein